MDCPPPPPLPGCATTNINPHSRSNNVRAGITSVPQERKGYGGSYWGLRGKGITIYRPNHAGLRHKVFRGGLWSSVFMPSQEAGLTPFDTGQFL